MKQEKFTVEEVQEISDMTSPSVKNSRKLQADGIAAPNVVVVQQIRCRS
ncbi:MAG: hypothetical protein MRZ56_02055 [Sutterella sp.]|nr:hypothetical protein [Sutterella sp.]